MPPTSFGLLTWIPVGGNRLYSNPIPGTKTQDRETAEEVTKERYLVDGTTKTVREANHGQMFRTDFVPSKKLPTMSSSSESCDTENET